MSLNFKGFETSYQSQIQELAESINNDIEYKKLANDVLEVEFTEYKNNDYGRAILLGAIMTVIEEKHGFFKAQSNEAYKHILSLRNSLNY